MNTRIKSALLLMFAMALTGCGYSSFVVSSVESYSQLPEIVAGSTIHLVPASPVDGSSLQWKAFRKKFEAGFIEKGFVISDASSATYIASIAYGIDGGTTKEELVSKPVYGQTGGGTVTHKNENGWIVGTSQVEPSYGVVDTKLVNVSRTNYRRYLSVGITEKSRLEGGARQKVYEGRLNSIGSCSIMNEVIDEIIEGFFMKFPKESGTVAVKGVYDC